MGVTEEGISISDEERKRTGKTHGHRKANVEEIRLPRRTNNKKF